MLSVRGTSISFCYPGAVASVFAGLDFCISPESRIGLVGPNGCGKTTLLKLLTAELRGYSGELMASDLRAATLPQQLDFFPGQTGRSYVAGLHPEIQRIGDEIRLLEQQPGGEEDAVRIATLYADYGELGGFELEAVVARLADEFGLDQELLDRPAISLSGGEKTKLALLRLLTVSPGLLLLDEPTNHLDVQTLEWLEGYLARSKIAYLVISHDRRFLDQCCNEIWELKNGSLSVYSGNYSFFRAQKEQALQRQIEDAEQAARQISRLKAAAGKVRNDADSIENFKPARSISKNGRVCQRDEGSGKALLRTQNKQRAATVLEKRLQRTIEKAEAERPFIEKKRSISFAPSRLKNSTVLRVEELRKIFAQKVVLSGFNLIVNNGDRLAVVGANGSGKTTLLRILAGLETASAGSVSWAPDAITGYYAQEFEQLDPELTILEQVLQGDLQQQTRARTILGCLKLEKDKVNQQIKTLSIGEKSKTALARLLFVEPDVLLLDEPTNHLEIDAREALEEALEGFSGTLIFVSHDRYFVDRLARSVKEL